MQSRVRNFYIEHKVAVLICAALLGAVALLWILSPIIIRYYLNHKLFPNMGSYTGYVRDVDVNLLTGSYTLNDFVLWRKDGDPEMPFFRAESFFIGLSWEGLIHGSLLATTVVEGAELNFLDAENSQGRQTGKGTDWRDVLDELLPTTLHRFEVRRSRITFQNFDAEPNVDVHADNIEAVVTNLTNVRDNEGRRVATARLQAIILDGAPINAEAEFDPFDFNDFFFAAEIREIDLPNLNTLTMHYANLDFAGGHGSIFAELVAEDGALSGYVKPLLEDVNIASWEQDVEKQGDNPLQLLWEGALGFIKTLFTNQSSKQFATQVDIRGTLDDAKIGSWKAVWGVVRNAFVEALEARFDKLTPLTRDDSADDPGSDK